MIDYPHDDRQTMGMFNFTLFLYVVFCYMFICILEQIVFVEVYFLGLKKLTTN